MLHNDDPCLEVGGEMRDDGSERRRSAGGTPDEHEMGSQPLGAGRLPRPHRGSRCEPVVPAEVGEMRPVNGRREFVGDVVKFVA